MKKHLFLKSLLIAIGLLVTSINSAWGQTFGAGGQQQTAIQSQQIMNGGAYKGTVYEPFSGTTPSEQSYSPVKAPGGPRKGYNPETGEWTPDSPDIETAGDYGQSEESPIGEPWVMALFALAFAGVIAIRQYKRKTVKSMNMKNSTSKFIATLALLCTLSVGQMWGWTLNYPYIYFNNSNSDGSQKWDKVMFLWGHNSASKGNNMTQISNTNLWFLKGENWGNSMSNFGFGFANTQDWGNADVAFLTRWGYLNSGGNNIAHTGYLYDNTSLDYNTYYFTSSGSDNLSVTKKADSGNWPESTLPEYSAYVKVRKSENGGSSYNSAMTSGTWPGTIHLQGTKIKRNGDQHSGNTPYGERDGDCAGSDTNSGSQAAYDGNIVTGLITMTRVSTDDAAYEFAGWGTGDSPTSTGNTKEYHITGNTTYYAFFKRKQFIVTFAPKGTYGSSTVTAAISTTPLTSGSSYNYGSAITFTATPAAGYKLNSSQAWYSDASCETSLGNGTNSTYSVASLTSAKSVYVKFVAKQSVITFSQSGEGYASGGQSTTKTATYGSAMPTTISVPTAATGYKFQGYYDAEDGEGTKYYNADGSSARNWDKDTEDGTTLYAYFENVTISNMTFTPSTAAGEAKVVATPTFSLTPVGTVYVFWKLFKNAECTHEVEGVKFKASSATLEDLDNDLVAETNPSTNNASVAFKTPAYTGSYYLQTIVRDASAKPYHKLDSAVFQYIVASDHTVKIKYMCEGVEIAPQDEVVVPAASYKGVKALSGNDVFGYQFSSWSLGDGLSDECADPSTCGAAGKDSIYISAVYNGTLTANYTKKNIIFFKDNLGWTNPENADAHMYVHLKSASEWNSSRGVGNKYNYYSRNNQMNRVPGTSNIFYYEYGDGSISKYIAFTKYSYDNYESFSGSVADPAQVVYVTNPTPASSDMSANYGFDAATPMFVPLDKTTYAGQLWNSSEALYFNRGYWVNYIGEETGYYLDLYDADGSSLIKSVKFTSEDKLMSMSVTLDLEAAKDYYFKLRRGSSITYGNSGYMKSNNSGTSIGWEFKPDVDNKCKIKTTAAGDYTFLLSYSGNDAVPVVHALRIGVTYPSSTGDYRIVYKDRAEWSQGSAHSASWCHPSRVITQRANGEDMVSFYISKAEGANASLTLQQVSAIDPSTGAITWTAGTNISSVLSTITESGVYNFKVTQDEDGMATVTYEGAYEGNYYIRTDNAGSSKWSDYIALDHQMTYSEYAQNSGYTHYYMHYCQRGTNVKFCIANDYSPCISDTLIRDITKPFDENMDASGFLYTTPDVAEYADKYSANIRFMWNQNTNKISRAYLSSAQMDNILVLTNNGTTGSVMDENDVDKSGVNIKFRDDQNWIYEADVKVKPSANVRLKVFARYSNAGNTATKDQYLIGSYNSGTYDASSSELLLTGSGDVLQTIRILYDFKTNRLVKAWMPTAEIEGAQTIEADLMIVREHQQSAQNILLKDKGLEHGALTTDKKIYAVMRFNRWILSNRANPNDKSDSHAGDDYYIYHPLLPVGQWLPTYERSLYYISFPFDVKISEIFGFGNYGTHYAIQYYDGEGRAKNGYWIDSDPNWKWIPPTGTLKAYEGYVLSLSMSNMDAGNTAVWTNKSSEIELYFPSTTTGTITIQNTNVKIDSLDSKTYKCTIERDKRNIKDSYWRCIGVPSYADYSGTLTDDKAAVINWQKEDIELPFIYEINWQDKSLTPYVGTTFPFKAMHSYLVQYGGEIHWTNVVNKPSSIVAREKSADAEHIFQLELSQNEEYCDRTFVRMTDNEGVTNNFDFNHDLSKETNAGRANIWTLTADSVSAAGNSMPISNQATIVPVGVKIVADGDYTFALLESVEGVGVVLIDNIAGTRTNLALTDYTVNLTAGSIDDRFTLELSPIAQVPTGIENTGDNQNDNIRKVMVDGVLYIVKEGKVFDARGNRIQ